MRDDSGVYAGYTVPNFYDPMISKLSVWAPTRAEAIARAKRALAEYVVKGITTNVRYLLGILDQPEFVNGDYDTSFLPRNHEAILGKNDPHLDEIAVMAAAVHAHEKALAKAKQVAPAAGQRRGRLRLAQRRPRERVRPEVTPSTFRELPMRYFATIKGHKEQLAVDVEPLAGGRYAVTLNGKRHELDALTLEHGAVSILVDQESYGVEFEEHGDELAVLVKGQVTRVDVADERKLRMRAAGAGFTAEGKQTVLAPMPGKVVKVLVKVGDEVKEGQGLVVVEAMKMENELKSPKAGKVTELFAKEGTTVENNAKLVVVE